MTNLRYQIIRDEDGIFQVTFNNGYISNRGFNSLERAEAWADEVLAASSE